MQLKSTTDGRLATIVLAVFLAGCAANNSGTKYAHEQAGEKTVVRTGVIQTVRETGTQGTKTGIGSTTGSVIGNIGGSMIGGPGGLLVGAVVGVVLGMAGAAAEEGITRQPATEISVHLDSGETTTVVQEGDEVFKTGDQVRLVSTAGGGTRITH